jgi:predicted amidohydrolase YtcJ
MTKRTTLRLLLIALVCSGCAESQDSTDSGPADLILTNGRIQTAEGWAEAISVVDGRIVAVGDAATIAEQADGGTEVVDLDGRTVLPGFHDLHVHPTYGGIIYSGADHTNCKIAQGSSVEVLVDAVRGCVAAVSGSEWVTGGQWDTSALGQAPHRSMLDAVSPDTPVILNDTSGHSVWANSVALRLAGVTADTPDPEGGIIDRDSEGNPTGVLRESANGLVRRHVPPPSDEVIRESLEWALQTMLSYGITSFTDASTGFVGGASRAIETYANLADEGILKQRVRLCLNWRGGDGAPGDEAADLLVERREQYERDRLTLDCVKIFLDGVPTDSHTAAMLDAYEGTVEGRDDDASRYGLLMVEQSVTNAAVTRFDAAGLTVKFHAAGDAAVRSGLDAIEAARDANGMSALRHNVGHCTFIATDDITRARELNATFELSPYLWSPSPINDDITMAIGPKRIERVWPFREAIDSGALVVAGSDWAVVPSVNPWIAIESLVTREESGGSDRSYGKAQAISVAEALDLFTVNSAKHMGRENELGSLEPGMIADFIVLDQNPFDVPATELHRTEVVMTYIGGEKVYDDHE